MEDSALLREVLIEELNTLGVVEVVGVAVSADEAIAQFDRLAPDVVVMDLALSCSSGFDALRAIRRQSPGCFVIIYSGHDEPPFRALASQEGASAFVSKAASSRELLARVESAVVSGG